MDSSAFSSLVDYFNIMGKDIYVSESFVSAVKLLFESNSKVLLSDNKITRGLGKIKRMERYQLSEITEKAVQFFALEDAFNLLHQKGVPVYFYNRIGHAKAGYKYTRDEERRMKAGLSFPKMHSDIDKYEKDLQEIFGEKYSKDYVYEIGKIPQVIRKGNTYQHEDYNSEVINIISGKRITAYQPQRYTRTIHVYGRCGVFGYAVEDKDTLPSLLQKELIDNGITDIRVINHGLWGGIDEYLDHNFLQDAVEMKQGDIVVFYRMHFDKRILHELTNRGMRYKEITDEWHSRKQKDVTFFDRPGHMNANGYKLVAKIIGENLIKNNFACGDFDGAVIVGNAEHLKNYLRTRTNNDFENEIATYLAEIQNMFPLNDKTNNNGAIVMNCNPFTKGHRYLIEAAAKQVDRLYIFVVEEDKSFFLFKDRLDMVQKGTEDIPNVVVVPSGKFIISAYTFPEYFMKDYVKEKNFDVSMDIETFCKYIAPSLNIRTRFAGEEPFDPVTKNYNESMTRILPQYGMNFIEIPRYALDSGNIINATKVRELLKCRQLDELMEYVPLTTYDILLEKYYS